MRPDWDSYFMKIAYAVSERSTCDRAFVGCVLVLDKRILTTGFNGSPAGQEHCDEVGHLMVDGHCVRTIHAETNAIIQRFILLCDSSALHQLHESAHQRRYHTHRLQRGISQ
jgi:deoxycytidylate deaminase